jgi:uncharacterized protein (TIGR03086 family)
MTDRFDIGPAVIRVSGLLLGVTDDQLNARTPCEKSSLGDLIDHVGGLSHDASRLGAEWRERISASLGALADAWRDPAAWEGMTSAGGVDMPGEVAALVALDEVVVHGWDIARASGQPYDVDPGLIEACMGFVEPFSRPGHEAGREGLYGPVVPVS